MKAAMYARYSTDMQREQSIDDQYRNCEKRADAEGWKVVLKFADKGISGTRNDRPQYRALLAAAERKEFEILLLHDLSRFGRDQLESERAIRRLEFHGIRIVAVSDGYDSTSKSRKMHRGMRQLFNEQYLEDLRENTIKGLTGQAIKQFWCGGRPYGYSMQPILDTSRRDQYGAPVRIGTKLQVDKQQAKVVRQIFKMFADGHGCKAIATELNSKGIPSPGSMWAGRKTRRAQGWMNSAVREILRNELYVGKVVWNRSQWTKDPDTGIRHRKERPQAEWVQHTDKRLRIVEEQTWKQVQRLVRAAKRHKNPHTGGKPRYLLSGLLICGSCGSNYILCNNMLYACSSNLNGKACDNNRRLRRDHAETAILDPLREKLLSPKVAAVLAKEIQTYYAERIRAGKVDAAELPKDLQELDARIARLRARLRAGDPDMAPDEIQAALDRAQAKRDELAAATPAAVAKVLAVLPGAMALYRKQVDQGLGGSPAQANMGRVALRELLGGPITLKPAPKRGLVAHFALHKTVLLQGHRVNGSGGRI